MPHQEATPKNNAPEPMWTLKMPQAEGKFWVRTRLGEEGGIVNIVRTKTGFMCAEYPVRRDSQFVDGSSWGGYYWPVVLPQCPSFQMNEDAEIALATEDFLYAPTTLFGAPIVRYYVRGLQNDERFDLSSMEKYVEHTKLNHIKESALSHTAICNSLARGDVVVLLPFPKKQAAPTRLTITFWDSEEGLEVDLHGETLEALHNELCRYDGCAPSGSIHVYDEAGFIVGWVSTGGWRSA